MPKGLTVRDRLIQNYLTVWEIAYVLAVELSFQSADHSQEREVPAQNFQILPHSGHDQEGSEIFEMHIDLLPRV
jgi:hypothetical protein